MRDPRKSDGTSLVVHDGEAEHFSPFVFGLSRRAPLIFHMYDDRGAILVASNESALTDLRPRFTDLIIP
jgi:hypothetical protein